MKFVIWGAGKKGRIIYGMLGTEHIAAYIEGNTQLCGTEYKGIPIIDFETYKKEYWKYPIIVSPYNYEDEILTKLRNGGIEWAFSYSKYEFQLIGFLRQAPLDTLMCDYHKNEMIYIYGFNPLGLLMYDYMRKKGYRCQMILQTGISQTVRTCVMEFLQIEIQMFQNMISGSRVLLAEEPDKQETLYLNDGYKMEIYYDLGERDELYYNPKIERFKNCHCGKRCFIVATGPSLTVEDLDVLYKNQEVCIGVNGIFKIFDRTKWRPDYYVISDISGMLQWKNEILAMDVKTKFITDSAWNFENMEVSDNMYRWHMSYKWENGKEPDFSDDFARKSCWGKTITYEGALQLAVYMGVREIYLLGVDCVQYKDQRKQHFVESYGTEASHLHIDDILLSYQAAKKYADSHGIKIYNVTRGGKLEVFERVDFDSLFENGINNG